MNGKGGLFLYAILLFWLTLQCGGWCICRRMMLDNCFGIVIIINVRIWMMIFGIYQRDKAFQHFLEYFFNFLKNLEVKKWNQKKVKDLTFDDAWGRI